MVENALKSLEASSIPRVVSGLDRRVRNLEKLFNQPIDAARLTNIEAFKITIDNEYIAGAPTQSITSTSYVDVNDSLLNFHLDYAAKLLILMNCDLSFSFTNDSAATLQVGFSVDNEDPPLNSVQKRAEQKTAAGVAFANGAFLTTHMTHRVRDLSAGDHTLRIKAKLVAADLVGTTQVGHVLNFGMSYVILGT